MLTMLFVFMMFAVFGKLIAFSFRAAWGLTKYLLWLVFLPVIIIGIFAAGLVYLALPILTIVGIISMIKCAF